MPKRSLTQLFVDRIGPPKAGRVEYWDTHLPSFGLRVSASGAKSWVVMFRVHGGDRTQVRETLGRVRTIPFSRRCPQARSCKPGEGAGRGEPGHRARGGG